MNTVLAATDAERSTGKGVSLQRLALVPIIGSMLRLLSSLMVALALFFSPLAMSGEGGRAMAHEAQSMEAHCADEPLDSDADTKAELDCASTCSAVAPASSPAAARAGLLAMAAEDFRLGVRPGIQPESETPPPRFS